MVTPATLAVLTTLRPARRLINVLLPTLGTPTTNALKVREERPFSCLLILISFKSFFVNCIIFTILAFAMIIVNSIFMEEQLAIFGIVIINLTVLLFVGLEAVLYGIYLILLKGFYNNKYEK